MRACARASRMRTCGCVPSRACVFVFVFMFVFARAPVQMQGWCQKSSACFAHGRARACVWHRARSCMDAHLCVYVCVCACSCVPAQGRYQVFACFFGPYVCLYARACEYKCHTHAHTHTHAGTLAHARARTTTSQSQLPAYLHTRTHTWTTRRDLEIRNRKPHHARPPFGRSASHRPAAADDNRRALGSTPLDRRAIMTGTRNIAVGPLGAGVFGGTWHRDYIGNTDFA